MRQLSIFSCVRHIFWIGHELPVKFVEMFMILSGVEEFHDIIYYILIDKQNKSGKNKIDGLV